MPLFNRRSNLSHPVQSSQASRLSPATRSSKPSSRSSRRWKRFFIFITILVSTLFLLAALIPFLPADKFWPVALLGYVFAVILLLTVLLLIGWLIARSRWAMLPLLALMAGYQQIRVAIGFHFFSPAFKTEKPAQQMRVMLWNVSGWDEGSRDTGQAFLSYRNLMMEEIRARQADVLCLQEFFEPRNSKLFPSNIAVLEQQGYLYHHFFPVSITYSGRRQTGMIILSKWPILDSGSISFGQTPHSEGLISADIAFNGQRVRIYSTHLESSRTNGGRGSGSVGKARNAIWRLRNNYAYRTTQARLVHDQISHSPYPVVVCGNLGDVPNSYAYFQVRGDLQDAFLERGAGFGRTFRFISPTLRLDCIFADNRFKVAQLDKPRINYSDHYPLVADLHF